MRGLLAVADCPEPVRHLLEDGVAILYNRPDGGSTSSGHVESEAGVLEEVGMVLAALRAASIPCREVPITGLREIPSILSACSESVIFNLVEGCRDSVFDHCLVPALCRASGKAFTGGGERALLITFDKGLTRACLQQAGVPVPDGWICPVGGWRPPSMDPSTMVIAKPACSDGSEGITRSSVLPAGDPALRPLVESLWRMTGQAVVIEAFVDGREFNVSVIEAGGAPHVLPLAEIDFAGLEPGAPRIVDYAAKWDKDSPSYANTPRVIPARVDDALRVRIENVARAAWVATGCSGYARVDIRVDRDGNAYVIDVNPNPDISPDAGFPAALAAASISSRQFAEHAVASAAMRLLPGRPPNEGGEGATAVTGEGPCIRTTISGDREAVLGMLAGYGIFRSYEIDVAREVLDAAIAAGPGGHYQSLTALSGTKPCGWVCFGPTPCTEGTFDIYWIVVDRDAGRAGIGRALLAEAERMIRARGGRLCVIETSGRDAYAPAQAFYKRQGYELSAVLRDFYAPRDDKLVFLKVLGLG